MKLVYCSANIYLLLYISHFLLIISCRHLKHTADKCTCAWEFKKPFIFCFITLRCIQAKITEQLVFSFLSFLDHFIQSNKMSFIGSLYNNQINARALIGQSAVGYCYYKPMENRAATELLYKSNRHKFLWLNDA